MNIKLLTYTLLLITVLSVNAQNKFELIDIVFEGNNSLSDQKLYDAILTKESPNWFSKFLYSFSNLGEPPIYLDTNATTSDIENLKAFYRSNGFFKARVNSKYELDTLNKTALLKFKIFENDPAYFKELKIKGLDKLTPELTKQVKTFIDVDSSDIFTNNSLLRMRNEVIQALLDHGYMLAEADFSPVKIDTIKNYVFTGIKFKTGNRYKINSVNVTKSGEGKDLVDEQLLKEIVNIKPKDFYSFFEIQQGQVRLYRTNLFSSALITPVTEDTVGKTVPINISANIGLLNELSPELIMNNEDDAFNLGLGLGYSRKNFLGNARQFTIGLSAAAQDIYDFVSKFSLSDTTLSGYADARATLQQPYIFGKPINTQFQVYTTLQKRRNEWNASIYGTKINFDFELPRYTYLGSFGTYLNWENSNFFYNKDYYGTTIRNYLSQVLTSANVDSIVTDIMSTGNLTSETNNTVLGVEFGANKTNDFLFPTNGYYLGLVVEDGNSISNLFSKIFGQKGDSPQYAKLVFNAALFPEIFSTRQSAFALKFKIGNIFNYSGNKSQIPFNQRFYSGGSNSVRGWRTRDLVPPDPDFDISNIRNEDFQDFFNNNITPGGFFILEGSVETRTKLSSAIGSSVFIDYGNTYNSLQDFRWDHIAIAFGLGIRYYSDFAPFRLDFGFKAYDPNDNRSFFEKNLGELMEIHFGIGEAF